LASLPVQVIDDGGNQVTLNHPAKRIISLSPHITELLFAAGARSKVIATVTGSDYPEAALGIQKIGRVGVLDYEAILALQPDLIVGWLSGNRHENIARLKKLGFKVFLSEPKKLEDIARNLKSLGLLAGTRVKANSAAANYQDKLQKLKLKYQHKKSVKVFYLLWHKPILTINSEHIISDVIKLCGGVNVFAKLPVYTPTVDFETVLLENPEVIITAAKGNKEPEWLARWRQWQGITAVKHSNFLWLEPDWIHRQTPRILLAADKMCEFLDEVRSGKKNY
jgi:iron complex transport system substrate-binding protein